MVGKIVIVGYDATPEGRRAIENGKIYGDVIQYPDEIGHLAIQTIQDYLEGRKVPSVIPVKVGTYTGNH
jgi:ribose transport system substrate-binding protein